MPQGDFNPGRNGQPRRWTIVAAGLLLIALALVVIYTARKAFLSPLALVVVAAIGLTALLLQLHLRHELKGPAPFPLWLSGLGVALALVAVLADILRIGGDFLLAAALGAVVCFAISGFILLDALRKGRA